MFTLATTRVTRIHCASHETHETRVVNLNKTDRSLETQNFESLTNFQRPLPNFPVNELHFVFFPMQDAKKHLKAKSPA